MPIAASAGARAMPHTQPPTENHGPLCQSSRRPKAAQIRSPIDGRSAFTRNARIRATRLNSRASPKMPHAMPTDALSIAGIGAPDAYDMAM
ncbi:hypothetical protein D3C73_1497760 [compost metagenome]